MLVEQRSEGNPLTPVSSPDGSHRHHRHRHHLSLNHTTVLSPISQPSSHSPSDSSSPQDESSSTNSGSTLKTLPSTTNHNNFSPLQSLFSKFGDHHKRESTSAEDDSGSDSPRTGVGSDGWGSGNTASSPYGLNESSKLLVTIPLGTPQSQGSDKSEGNGDEHYQRRTISEYHNDEEHLVPTHTTSPNGSINNNSKVHECPVCSITITSRHQFNEHLVTHTKQHTCPKCSYTINDKNMLRTHMQDTHGMSEPDPATDDELEVPKVNSQGKLKTFKCKQCDYTAVTKRDFWQHSKTHIREEKILKCPTCPFVTEYKHHLEYHLRNHIGSKPFQCNKCNYSCVNKSMLNSHLKSHSNVYQYRCADCSYATKYCHSLKLHLRKYNHAPSMVLNLDGTPNPLPIIDVYGTRRGPKMKRPDSTLQPSCSSEYNSLVHSNKHSNQNSNVVKKEVKKRSRIMSTNNTNNNNVSAGPGSGGNGTRSPVLIKQEPHYEDHISPPPLRKHSSHTGSDNNSDSEQESKYSPHSFPVQQDRKQIQISRHQMPETPVTPTSIGLHGLLTNSLNSATNGHGDHPQQFQAAAAAAAAAAVAGKSPLELYAVAMHQYLLANNPLLHIAPPFQDLAKLAKEQQQQILSQILLQSPMMPQSQSGSPPPLPNGNGHRLSPYHTQPQAPSPQSQSQSHTPLDLTNPRTSPTVLETPAYGDIMGGKRKRKGRAVRYGQKVSRHPMDLAENMIMDDPDVALDFSNNNNNNYDDVNNIRSRNGCFKVEKESFQSLEAFSPSHNGQKMCKYCEISFLDQVLYSMHMSYHSGDVDPFLCKSCGKKTKDKITFFQHLTTDQH